MNFSFGYPSLRSTERRDYSLCLDQGRGCRLEPQLEKQDCTLWAAREMYVCSLVPTWQLKVMPDPPYDLEVPLFVADGTLYLCLAAWNIMRTIKESKGHSDIVFWFVLAHTDFSLIFKAWSKEVCCKTPQCWLLAFSSPLILWEQKVWVWFHTLPSTMIVSQLSRLQGLISALSLSFYVSFCLEKQESKRPWKGFSRENGHLFSPSHTPLTDARTITWVGSRKICFSYVTNNVTWAEQQKGGIFLYYSSWESPTPYPSSPQFSCTSQKQLPLLVFSPGSQSFSHWGFFYSLSRNTLPGWGSWSLLSTESYPQTRQMVAVSWAKDANRAVLMLSGTYSLVILLQWKLPIRSAGARSLSNYEIRALENEHF